MKKFLVIVLFLLMWLLSEVFAGRWCCSWHGGQAYCWSNWMWMCNDGTQSPSCSCSTPSSSTYSSNYYAPSISYTIPKCWYNEQLINGVCVSNSEACPMKYPWTVYNISQDKCICENWWEYDSSKKKCINKDQECNAKYPGTEYQASNDKCICRNGWEYNEVSKSCYTAPKKAIKCIYTDWTKANAWDRSAQGAICGIDWTWGCATNTIWNSKTNKCLSKWDYLCQEAYGEFSVWNKTKTKGQYDCTCKSWYKVVDDKCAIVS